MKDLPQLDPKTGTPIQENEEAGYYYFPGFPGYFARKEYCGRHMTLDEWISVVQAAMRGEKVHFTNFVSEKNNTRKEYAMSIGLTLRDKLYVTVHEFDPINPLSIKCPKSGKPVDDAGKFFKFPGFPRLYCSKVICGRTMTAEDYVKILEHPGESVSFDNFISKKQTPFSAPLKYSSESGRIEFDFQQKTKTTKNSTKREYKPDNFGQSQDSDTSDDKDVPNF